MGLFVSSARCNEDRKSDLGSEDLRGEIHFPDTRQHSRAQRYGLKGAAVSLDTDLVGGAASDIVVL
jgi:hypothetical protein